MDPKSVIERLMEGNARFMKGELERHDVKTRREETLQGQHPMVTVVACSDSRVVPEFIFDTNLGDVFTIATAGNVVDDITIGSMEYGVAHAHTPVLMILGKVREGKITSIMEKIEPAIKDIMREGDEETMVTACAMANVKAVMAEILEKSDIIRDSVVGGQTMLVGAIYHLSDGRIEIFEEMKKPE